MGGDDTNRTGASVGNETGRDAASVDGDVAATTLESIAAPSAADGLLENVPTNVDVSAVALKRVRRSY